ncbi:hypothetical protein [Pseudomonas fluorescens]|uniref:hypothetical protein n=1 Tax=Pseudomonas fluorescens TaxID=294 RepID=UPI001147000A|nr:hypothetical protein [Pseudomonas fluorescens]
MGDFHWFRPAEFTAWALKKFPTLPKVVELLNLSASKLKPNEPTNAALLAIAGLLELLMDADRQLLPVQLAGEITEN